MKNLGTLAATVTGADEAEAASEAVRLKEQLSRLKQQMLEESAARDEEVAALQATLAALQQDNHHLRQQQQHEGHASADTSTVAGGAGLGNQLRQVGLGASGVGSFPGLK
eukprot:gene2540-2842_t